MYRILLISTVTLFQCTTKESSSLKAEVETILQNQKGIFAVAFKDLTSGEELLIRERESFHAASTMKTPVMIEVYKQAEEGRFSLTDSVPIKNEFRSIVDGSSFQLDSTQDSEHSLYKQIGKKRLLSDLVYDMIIVSSNLATNLIIEWVDAKNVTQTMRDLGAKDIQVLRGVEDTKAFEHGMNNSTTAYDLMLIFENIAREKMVSAEASQQMTEILLDQRFNDIIPRNLPPEVKVAHKTGNITGVHHDSGIVILPNGKKYVLVLLSKNLEDEESGKKAMASVSEVIYGYVIKN
jgi:beta-lactamase class A